MYSIVLLLIDAMFCAAKLSLFLQEGKITADLMYC